MKLRKMMSAAILAILTSISVSACAPAVSETVTVRLWDENVAAAYKKSFAEFTKDTGIKVEVKLIPWSDYWSQLRIDIAANSIDDIFWVNAGNYEEYSKRGDLLEIKKSDFNFADWDSSVVNQYTTKGALWGVPQLSDPGIGLFYNQDLLEKNGIKVEQISTLKWNPQSPVDSLRTVTQLLTRDSANRPASDPNFDPTRVQSYGFNAGFDLNAIVLNFLGSNGASWQKGDKFTFDSPKGRETFQYLANLINKQMVSPPASDTNPPAGGNLSRDLFIQGRMALFESGAYNLANIQTGAKFKWGVTTIPAGPSGSISVTNGIIAAASSKSTHQNQQLKVLQWMAGEGAKYIGQSGSALTAVKSARSTFFDYWKGQNIDVSAMLDVLANGYVQAPRGAKYGEAEAAYLPLLNNLFTGEASVQLSLTKAQMAANKAMEK